MIVDDKRIRSVRDLLTAVTAHRQKAKQTQIWFRGSTIFDYPLVPSLGRAPFKLEQERALINAFKQNAVQFFDERPHTSTVPSAAGFCSSALPSGIQSPCFLSIACRSSMQRRW